MTKVQEGYVPILDLRLRCGQSVLEVPLWRGEALSDLYVGDEVELTHLKAFLKENGKGKLNSSTYTTIKIAQRKVDTAVVEIVGVSDGTDSLTLLSGNFEEFAVSASLYRGMVEHPAPEETVTSRFIQSIQPRHLSPTVLWFWTASALGFLGSTTDVFELALQHCQGYYHLHS
ncbi:cis-aconitate decarboxylase-like protein [Labeo rohita]|uniref:Cis-aconitate decarboxylase-like protein n=1 Tax=Labeo rohita TaxID=84645 RepID=A0A498MZK1_LABRO|nr:cis-aconitate decarboxylase-like protein [Labeo rohita]